MVDQKYLELINKEIDNTISASEKELLDKYLRSNPEAYTMRQELSEAEKLLDRLPDKDPSISLKQRILHSIDFDRYAYKKKKSIAGYFSAAFSGPRKKLTTSFAFGLVTGIIILSIIFYTSYHNNLSEVNTVFGTMGLPESEVLKSVDVNSMDIAGKIEISKAANHYWVFVNLSSSKKYTLQIEFDQTNLKVESQSDNSPYSFLLSANEIDSHKLLLKILRDESKLFEHEILLSKR